MESTYSTYNTLTTLYLHLRMNAIEENLLRQIKRLRFDNFSFSSHLGVGETFHRFLIVSAFHCLDIIVHR